MAKLGEIVRYVRSKNAGPFWLTIEIFCEDQESYERLVRAPTLSKESIAALYGADPTHVKIFHLPQFRALKISLPRPVPQGSLQDWDVHAGQQYVQLLDVPID